MDYISNYNFWKNANLDDATKAELDLIKNEDFQ